MLLELTHDDLKRLQGALFGAVLECRRRAENCRKLGRYAEAEVHERASRDALELLQRFSGRECGVVEIDP